MKPFTVTAESGEEYQFQCSDEISCFYEEGRLVISAAGEGPYSIDLSSLTEMRELGEIYISFRGNAKIDVLTLPDTSRPLRCEVHSSSVEIIEGKDFSETYFFLLSKMGSIQPENGKTASVTIEIPDSLDFLKNGYYDTVTIESDRNLLPSGDCKIQKLVLIGKKWALNDIADNRSITELTVAGDVTELSSLRSSCITKLSVFGDAPLEQLENMDNLTSLSVQIPNEGDIDLSVLKKLENLTELSIYVRSDTYQSRYLGHISTDDLVSLCGEIRQLEVNKDVIKDFILNGGVVNVRFLW